MPQGPETGGEICTTTLGFSLRRARGVNTKGESPMTGRDLIIYILANNLEDELVFKNGKFIGYITVEEAAVKMNVGVAMIYALINLEMLDCVVVGDTVFIPADFKVPQISND